MIDHVIKQQETLHISHVDMKKEKSAIRTEKLNRNKRILEDVKKNIGTKENKIFECAICNIVKSNAFRHNAQMI